MRWRESMARSKNMPNEKDRNGRHSNDRDDDDGGFGGNGWWDQKFGKDDDWGYSHEFNNSPKEHESYGKNDCRRDNDGKSLEVEIDVDRHGKWLDIEIEIGKFDFDLKVD